MRDDEKMTDKEKVIIAREVLSHMSMEGKMKLVYESMKIEGVIDEQENSL